jgi:IMP dehydrogenase/GMP reductase
MLKSQELFSTKKIQNSTEPKFDFDDILIEPAITTEISSRSNISITYHIEFPHSSYEHLPLITAPMDTVVSKDNRDHFISNNINVCYPRGIETNRYNINGKMCFVSYSLNDFISKFIDIDYDFQDNQEINICIDTANGHIDTLKKSIEVVKEKYGKRLVIMAGNVANPYSYVELSKAGCNFVRLGVGNGGGCLTTQQTAIGYPMGSLIQECYQLKISHECEAKIVADGGMKKYSDIIKALALGADYVMVGNLFNKSLESCGDTFLFNRFKVDPNSKFAKWLYQNKFKLTKKFRGMSTKEVQKDWGKSIIKTSEGISTIRPIEYTLSSWTENFEHYLKSTMSYTNHIDLLSFVGNVEYNLITINAHLRYKK